MIYHGITHPRMGYKITTVPHNLRNATVGAEFAYSHSAIDAARCKVIALTQNSVGQRKYLVCLVDGDLLWAIHPNYHTGIDLAVLDEDGQWQAASDVDAVRAALNRDIVIADIQALINDGTILPEDELPAEAFLTPDAKARLDQIENAAEPYMRVLTGDKN